MRACLIPLRTLPGQVEMNFAELERRLEQAAAHAPDLVCLPECTLTGYLYEQADLDRWAEPLSGPTVRRFSGLARRFGIYLCAGLLEKTAAGVYNAALLFGPSGNVLLRHRKREEHPPFFCGAESHSVETPFGRVGILICGDLFNQQAVAAFNPPPDLLLIPMSRSFDGRSPDPARWEREERAAYLEAVRQSRIPALIVNALEEQTDAPAFGGALAVTAAGTLLAESPHGTDEILIVELGL